MAENVRLSELMEIDTFVDDDDVVELPDGELLLLQAAASRQARAAGSAAVTIFLMCYLASGMRLFSDDHRTRGINEGLTSRRRHKQGVNEVALWLKNGHEGITPAPAGTPRGAE
jgi:hypothetical protein